MYFAWYVDKKPPDFIHILLGTIVSNHLQGLHRKSLSKLSDMLIDIHIGQHRYQT